MLFKEEPARRAGSFDCKKIEITVAKIGNDIFYANTSLSGAWYLGISLIVGVIAGLRKKHFLIALLMSVSLTLIGCSSSTLTKPALSNLITITDFRLKPRTNYAWKIMGVNVAGRVIESQVRTPLAHDRKGLDWLHSEEQL